MFFGNNTRELKYNQKGLIPVIVQDTDTQQVLTYFYMNKEAAKRTKKSGELWLYHRKMKKVWKKGAKSGRTMKVVDMVIHHDRNVILVKAIPNGPACHTGNTSCFMNSFIKDRSGFSDEKIEKNREENGLDVLRKLFESQDLENQVEIGPAQKEQHQVDRSENPSLNLESETNSEVMSRKSPDFINKYFSNIKQKISTNQNGSYSQKVAELGSDKIAQKIGENAMQLMASTTQNDHVGIVKKEAEMIHHLLILLAEKQIKLDELKSELVKRSI